MTAAYQSRSKPTDPSSRSAGTAAGPAPRPTGTLDPTGLAWFEARGLDAELVVRYGIESASVPGGGDLLQRILAKIEVDSETGCWLWRGCLTYDRYPRIKVAGKVRGVHRVVHQLLIGPVAPGLEVDHTCRRTECVNPDHLEAVPPLENFLRCSNPARKNRDKRHCVKGHPFSGTNLQFTTKGGRVCRACMIEAKRRWRARRAGP